HVDDDLDPVVDRFLASMVLRRRVDDSEIRTVVAVVDAAGGEHEIVRHVGAHGGGLAAADEALAALRLRRRALPIAAGRTARAEVRACRPLAGDVRPVGAVAGFVLIAVVGRRPAHRARMSRRVLAVVAAAITLVAAAGVAVVAAGPAGGALRVGGAAGARSRAELRGVAFAGRGAAERR